MSHVRRLVALLLIVAASTIASACQSGSEHTAHRLGGPTSGPAQTAPVLQPGKPGQPNAVVTSGPLPTPAAVDADDARFMQDMITHHAQALRIVAVARSLLTDTQVKAIAGRIEAGQGPEIKAMSRWLTTRKQRVPMQATHPLMAPMANHQAMPGMASAQQLEDLARARGVAADRMFLTLMITHHRGALVMALDQRKHGIDDRATELSDDVSVTQTAEIAHMTQMLARLS